MEHFLTDSKSAVISSDRILYTPSSFARASLLHLQEVGTLTALKPHKSEHTGLSSYLFFTVLEGEGKVTYEGSVYQLIAGDCIFIDCHKSFSHETSATNLWTLQWCHFFGPTMTLIYDKYLERGGMPVFKPEEKNIFVSLLNSMRLWCVSLLFESVQGN